MKIGHAIRVVRSARGWSQCQLARNAELSPSTVSLIESGRRQPGTGAIERVSRSLGVPVHLLHLLAAEEGELRGISPAQAEEIGRVLVRLLSEAGQEDAQLWL